MTGDQERDTCLPQHYQRDTGEGFPGADEDLPCHMGGVRETGALWDSTEPLFPHQSLSVTPTRLGPTQCPQPAFLLLLQHHKKAVAETLVTFRPQPAACLWLPGSSPTGEGVSAQRPCGDMSLGCRSLREWWALHASAAWERMLCAQTPNNFTVTTGSCCLGPLPEAPIGCLDMILLILCVSRRAHGESPLFQVPICILHLWVVESYFSETLGA